MNEEIRLTKDIHNFALGKMDWKNSIELLGRVSKSEVWIDYLLMEMELYEYVNQRNRVAEDREHSSRNVES
ncbi:hypothetical protein DYD21_10385 [Rhodohalobacter sp. SW132]|nr:hypothetical protein [Rhodohalobacter sp. SW132]REL33804.1 hypothetical protein DYD21_10385 [Rhodohalobacter sp. SW132]